MSGKVAGLLRRLQTHRIARALATVRMAVLTMLGLALILAAGTVVESRYDAELARLVVYDRWWFHLVLGLLFLNILMAVVVRLPLRRHQLPFGCIHLGLLILLSGAFITKVRGIDGTMEISQGSTTRALRLPETVLRRYTNDIMVSEERISRGLTADRRPRRVLRGQPVPFVLEQVLPFVRVVQIPVADTNGGPLVELALMMGDQQPESFRLGLDEPGLPSRMETGPLAVSLERALSSAEFMDTARSAPARFDLAAIAGTDTVRLSLSDLRSSGKIRSQGAISVAVEAFYADADIGPTGIFSRSDTMRNPAARLRIRKGDSAWTEILYGKVPRFRFSGDAHRGVEWTVSFRPPSRASTAPALRLCAVGDSLFARCEKSGGVLSTFRSEPGRDRILPFGPLHLSVGRFLPRGVLRDSCIPVEPAPGGTLPIPAVQVGGPWGGSRWIPLGGAIRWKSPRGREVLSFEVRRVALPFGIRLDRFAVRNEPGSNQPASYESSVHVVDTSGKPGDSALIAMNAPLKRGGFTFYQASFSNEPGGTTTTILSVNKDPGRPWKYSGSILAILSIGWYVLERSRRGGSEER